MKKTNTSNAVDAFIKSEQENDTQPAPKPEEMFLTDIVMRMLAGRELTTCMNVTFSVINSVASGLPVDGRMFMIEHLQKLATHIAEMVDTPQQTVQ